MLDGLRKHKLKLQPDECEFLRKEANYFGSPNNRGRGKAGPTKVEELEQFPKPTTTKQLKTFCGMIRYYRLFIPNCSRIALPLYKLLKKNAKNVGTEAQKNAFQHLFV